jgi:hypothetical protein
LKDVLTPDEESSSFGHRREFDIVEMVSHAIINTCGSVSDLIPGDDDEHTESTEYGKWYGKYLEVTVRSHHSKASSTFRQYPSDDVAPVIPPESKSA